MYDTSAALPVTTDDGTTIGFLYPVNDTYFLPLDTGGNPVGPPSYRADAETILRTTTSTNQ